MNRALFFLIALCAITAASVPRNRREPKVICARQTPCGWSIYKPDVKIIEVNITNTYCYCQEGTVCQINEDDRNTNAYVHRCR